MQTQNRAAPTLEEVGRVVTSMPALPRCWVMLYHRVIHQFPDEGYIGWRVQLHRDGVLVVEVLWHDFSSAVTYAVEAADELFPSEWEGFKW